MKKLLLLRHGEANPAPVGGSDFERQLSQRGEQETERVAGYLRQKHYQPDILYVSSAVRTRQTAQNIETHVPFTQAKTVFERDIYTANAPALLSLIKRTEAVHDVVMLVGHNPTLYELAAWLCAPHAVDNVLQHGLPTCGLLIFSLDIAQWDEVREGAHDVAEVFVP
jgi:phosphohistidine phosphatase